MIEALWIGLLDAAEKAGLALSNENTRRLLVYPTRVHLRFYMN
jgi:hypothetical protein